MNDETLRFISKAVIIGAVAVVIIWDITAVILSRRTGELKNSVSYAIWEFTRRAPFIPLFVGIVCGHLWWGDPEISIFWKDATREQKVLECVRVLNEERVEQRITIERKEEAEPKTSTLPLTP